MSQKHQMPLPSGASPEPLTFRAVSADDAARINEIYAPSVSCNAVSFEETAPSEAEMQARIKRISATFPWLVAVASDGQVIGYAYASSHRERAAYRWAVEVSVYLDPEFQGRGIGQALYGRLFPILARLNYFRALAAITLPHDASVKLHEKLGFQHLGTYRKIGFKLGRWHDVGWWELELRPSLPLPPEPLSFSTLTHDEQNAVIQKMTLASGH